MSEEGELSKGKNEWIELSEMSLIGKIESEPVYLIDSYSSSNQLTHSFSSAYFPKMQVIKRK